MIYSDLPVGVAHKFFFNDGGGGSIEIARINLIVE